MTHPAAEWIPLFPEEEIPFILAAVLRSGAKLRKLHGTELENDLSDRLRDLLDREPSFRDRPVEIFREVPLYDRMRSNQRQVGRTDLMFLYSTGASKPWPYFVIETKRLHVAFESGWKSLVPEYVTRHQGMRCFIEGRYSSGLASGGMLGYVFDGAVEEARAEISAAIEANHKRLRCAPPPRFSLSSQLAGRLRVSESQHSLAAGIFTIYHLFLPV